MDSKSGTPSKGSPQSTPITGTPVMMPKWLDARLEAAQEHRAPQQLLPPGQASPLQVHELNDGAEPSGQLELHTNLFLSHSLLPSNSELEPYDSDICPHPALIQLHALRELEFEQHQNLPAIGRSHPAIEQYLSGLNNRLAILEQCIIQQLYALPNTPNCQATISTKGLSLNESLTYQNGDLIYLHFAIYPSCLHMCATAQFHKTGPDTSFFQFLSLVGADKNALEQLLNTKH